MRTIHRIPGRTCRRWTVGLWMLLAGCGAPPPLAIDPVPVQDDDRYDIAEPPERHRDDYYDVLDYTLFRPIGQIFDIPRQARKIPGKPYQARNITAFDEIQQAHEKGDVYIPHISQLDKGYGVGWSPQKIISNGFSSTGKPEPPETLTSLFTQINDFLVSATGEYAGLSRRS